MKKIYLLFCTLICAYASNAQTFANAGMETWRTGTSSSTTIYAPTSWYGFDSLVIAVGSSFAPILHPSSPTWNGGAQLFQENTITHSGSSSAKLVTEKQDTLGFFPGILSNAKPTVNTTELETIVVSGSGDPTTAFSYTGGTGVTQRIRTVSAWLQYKAGVTAGVPGLDTGIMIVQAIGFIGGRDSVLGTGTMLIPPTAGAFVQMTDTVVYKDSVNLVDTIRVSFASSGGAATNLDSSTLYVDDVTMAGTSEVNAVAPVIKNDLVKVYPNPATTAITFDGPQHAGLSVQLYNVTGQVVITQLLAGHDMLNIASLPAGLYTYAIADNKGNAVQKGKVTVAK